MGDMRHGPSQLMTIDAARISSIIEEALEKLSFLASITPDVVAHRNELSQIVGDEITRIIKEQRGLETQYEQLVAQRNSLKAQSNKTKVQENQDAIREVARALRESTKELTRNLKGNPNIAENLSKIQNERASLQSLLSKTLRELRECSFSTLTTTVEEEKLRTDMLLEVIANEKKVSAAVKSLQEQLAAERTLHETDVEERCARREAPMDERARFGFLRSCLDNFSAFSRRSCLCYRAHLSLSAPRALSLTQDGDDHKTQGGAAGPAHRDLHPHAVPARRGALACGDVHSHVQRRRARAARGDREADHAARDREAGEWRV